MIKSFFIRFKGISFLIFLIAILPDFINNSKLNFCLQLLAKPIYKILNTKTIGSDSKEMYQLIFLSAIISFIISLIWILKLKNKTYKNEEMSNWLTSIYSYTLSFFLFVYGFNKLFKLQFFIPEPNTLYTPVGLLSKDILFWTSMGSSYSYNVFMGIIEVVPACLLLFRRTRKLGGLISLAVLINVLMINIGFDISVKILSLFLICLSLFVLKPYSSDLISFFFIEKKLNSNHSIPLVKSTKQIIFKNSIICLIFFETLSPYFISNNFNDDLQKRSLIYGAYEVIQSIKENQISIIGNSKDIKRLFIHRRNYFIIQYQDDTMKDYLIKNDSAKNKLTIITEKGNCELKISQNNILIIDKNKITLLTTKKLNIGELPLLKKSFHLISEI